MRPCLLACTKYFFQKIGPRSYPYVQDVSSGDMLKAIRQALTRDGKFPLTLVVLDEVQQYIGVR